MINHRSLIYNDSYNSYCNYTITLYFTTPIFREVKGKAIGAAPKIFKQLD